MESDYYTRTPNVVTIYSYIYYAGRNLARTNVAAININEVYEVLHNCVLESIIMGPSLCCAACFVCKL